MYNVLAVTSAYLIGSLSFAVIVSKAYGMDDPRTYGSGNPGATNVLRSGKKKAAALTLLGNALKGFVAVWLARWLATEVSMNSSHGRHMCGGGIGWAYVADILPLQRRQRRGHCLRCVAGAFLAHCVGMRHCVAGDGFWV